MIYTVGKREIYERAIKERPFVHKAQGGSVWENLEQVKAYLRRARLTQDFRFYAVEADWRSDTIVTQHEWRSLSRPALLSRSKQVKELYLHWRKLKPDGKAHLVMQTAPQFKLWHTLCGRYTGESFYAFPHGWEELPDFGTTPMCALCLPPIKNG